MAFQIQNKEGVAIHLNQIDKEICKLLEIEYDKKWYCDVTNGVNWFDSIGFQLSELPNGVYEWSTIFFKVAQYSKINILEYLEELLPYRKDSTNYNGIVQSDSIFEKTYSLGYFKNILKVINYFERQEYIAVSL